VVRVRSRNRCAGIFSGKSSVKVGVLTLSLLMSYINGAPCKARNFNVVYICGPMFGNTEFNTESYPVAQLYVNSLLATKVTRWDLIRYTKG
jgi:hypothetical protein